MPGARREHESVEDAMPGAMRKMGVYLGLVEEDDGYAEVEPHERGLARGEYAVDTRAARAPEVVRQVARDWPGEADGAAYRNERGERGGRAEYSEYGDRMEFAEPDRSSYRITTLHPRTYNEARTIGEHFRAGTPVIMNLSEMDDSDAKRLVDFAAGLTFGLHGRIERVTAKVFLLSPHNVTVTAQDKARIADGAFFNQS
jgi:cell division inhibitor SepF